MKTKHFLLNLTFLLLFLMQQLVVIPEELDKFLSGEGDADKEYTESWSDSSEGMTFFVFLRFEVEAEGLGSFLLLALLDFDLEVLDFFDFFELFELLEPLRALCLMVDAASL